MTTTVRMLLAMVPLLLLAADKPPQEKPDALPTLEKLPLLAEAPNPNALPTQAPPRAASVPVAAPGVAPTDSSFMDELFGKYLPRIGYSYDAFDAVGRDGGLSSFQAFVPLYQDRAASRVVFSDSRLLLFDSRGSLGANLGLGGRMFSGSLGRTVGGYVYWDYTDTGRASFNQVSGGVETLGDLVDARANFYVPLGKDRKQVDQIYTANPEPTFQGNYLFVGGGQGTRFLEQALYGFDGEAGMKVMALEGLELRAFAGMYHYQGESTQQTWGPRGRLEARLRDSLAMGVSVQNDRLFGTTVNMNVLMTFPRLSGRAYSDGPSAPLPASDRLGDPVVRTQQVVVQRQQEQFVVAGQPLLDPVTQQPLYFLHVAPGGNSDGSFESPYATLAKAFADPRFGGGNVIVYDRTQGTFTGNVHLAPGTRLLSSAVVQYVDTTSGRVLLPFSGLTTEMPTVHGSITLGGSNTISGYNLVGVGQGAVLGAPGASLRDVVLVNNRFSGEGTAVYLPSVAGNIDIRNNIFQGPMGGGIFLGARGNDAASLAILNNQFARIGGDAIAVSASEASRIRAHVEGNQVRETTGTGVALSTGDGANSTIEARVTQNTIEDSAGQGNGGIALMTTSRTGGSSSITAEVSHNQLMNNLAPGVTARAVGPNVMALDLFENKALSMHSLVGFLLQQQRKGTFRMVAPDTVGSRNNGPVMTTGTIDAIPQLP
ncbi:MAG: inverse autotransporter beta domain-containing protein [Gemmataceae bacterium]